MLKPRLLDPRKTEILATRSRTCPNSHFTIGELSYSVYIFIILHMYIYTVFLQ